MKQKIYITEEERRKCQRVADAFVELEDEDIVVVDVGRYGFVKLQYYTPPTGFENDYTFTSSRELFEDLWEEWLHMQLVALARVMSIQDIDYDSVFAQLPEKNRENWSAGRKILRKKRGLFYNKL